MDFFVEDPTFKWTASGYETETVNKDHKDEEQVGKFVLFSLCDLVDEDAYTEHNKQNTNAKRDEAQANYVYKITVTSEGNGLED